MSLGVSPGADWARPDLCRLAAQHPRLEGRVAVAPDGVAPAGVCRFQVMSIGYDPWQSTQMSRRLRAEGLPLFEFRATTQNLSPAVIESDAAMRAGRLRHDANPVLEWCLSNVFGKAGRRGNLYPTKLRSEQKIDAAIALMMAIGRAMTEDQNDKNMDSFLSRPLFM
jgi:phage terminase large subunit-like protein